MGGTGKQGKVLVIVDEASAGSLLSTFLASMGCECKVTSSGKALGLLEREDFDAVVLDLRCSEISGGQLISKIEEAGSNLWKRILVITDDESDPQEMEPIYRQFLAGTIPRPRVFLQLWPSLESILASRRCQVAATRPRHVARLIFDSFRQPMPAGVRAFHPYTRQLVYEHANLMIDMVIEPRLGLARTGLVGQVLDTAKSGRRTENLPVVLLSPEGAVTAATTNRFGEFNLEFDLTENTDLEIRVGDDLLLPLEDMTWAKRRLTGSNATD